LFTGIIKNIGTVKSFSHNFDRSHLRMSIETQLAAQDLELGASIACNGCCLTVVDFREFEFTVEVGPETLERTNFSKVTIGSQINLEPALRVGDPLGGHQLTGHVDTLCSIVNFSAQEKAQGSFWELTLRIPKKFTHWVVPQGSIAVAGISLTIANILPIENSEDKLLEMMIIPHTYQHTILQNCTAGMMLEVEFDQIVKIISYQLQLKNV